MKKTIQVLGVLVLLLMISGGAYAKEDEQSGVAVRDAFIAAQEKEASTGETAKEKRRLMEKYKKQLAAQKNKERWTNLTPDKKSKEAMKKKVAALGSSDPFDETNLPKSAREHIQKLTPEDKEKNKIEAIKEWNTLSSDQKHYMKKNAKEKWNTLTTEEKEQFKAIITYDKAVNGTDAGIVTKPAKPIYKTKGGTVMPENYFGDSGPVGKSKTYYVQRDRSLDVDPYDTAQTSVYSYSKFGPGGKAAE